MSSYEPDFTSQFNFESPFVFTPSSDLSRPAKHRSHSTISDPYATKPKKSFLETSLEKAVVFGSYGISGLTAPVAGPFCFKTIGRDEVAVISRLGGELQLLEGGSWHWHLPNLDTFEKFSKNSIKFEIHEQKILTKDRYELTIKGSSAYKIDDPIKFVKQVAYQTRQEKFVEKYVVSKLRKIIGKMFYFKLEDLIGLKNQILIDCNYQMGPDWGLLLVTDELDFQIFVTKRGEDGPGDPMEQIVTLIRENFDFGSSENGGSGDATSQLAAGLGNSMGLDMSSPGMQQMVAMAKQFAQSTNIMEYHKNCGLPEDLDRNASSDSDNSPSKKPLLASSSKSQVKMDNPDQQVMQQLAPLMELEKFTGHGAKSKFDKLDGKLFQLTIVDLANPFPGYSSHSRISLFVNGRDIGVLEPKI